jgi:hypothetical protein
MKKVAAIIISVLFLSLVLAAYYAPYVDGELAAWLAPHSG